MNTWKPILPLKTSFFGLKDWTKFQSCATTVIQYQDYLLKFHSTEKLRELDKFYHTD